MNPKPEDFKPDYIVVGAGSAGCVLANRLTEDPRVTVLLLEAGPRGRDPWLHIPAGYYRHAYGRKYNWSYETEPVPGLDNRRIGLSRGKVLGGSSAINGLIYIRGQHADFDMWAQLGNRGWSYDDVLPYFRKSENQERGENRYHGKGGQLDVSDIRMRHELYDAFLEAAVRTGLPRNDDFNGAEQEGVGAYQMTVGKWRRSSTSVAFLKPAMRRPNLRVETGAAVQRIIFDGRRAVGVLYHQSGRTRLIHANREIILAGGTVNSPQLLQLSGIGPAGLLKTLGIPMVADLPGVGENLQDHLSVQVSFRAKNANTVNEIYHSWVKRAVAGIEYVTRRRGLLMMAGGPVGLFAKTRQELGSPDVQYHFLAWSLDSADGPMHRFPGCSLSLVPCRPESRGWIRIRSQDASAPPLIQPNYLATQGDRETTIAGLRLARRIFRTAPLADLVVAEHSPGASVESDEEWLRHIRATAGSGAHPVGTCKMGIDDMAVVDPTLRVKAVDGLRVVDASIMPTVVSGNTNAAAIMIAEKGADMIKEAYGSGNHAAVTRSTSSAREFS